MSTWIWFQDALLDGAENFALTADVVSYSLTGFSTGGQIVGSVTPYTLEGQDAGLHHNRAVDAGPAASYSLTGFGIGEFVRGFRMPAMRGEYSLEGGDGVLLIYAELELPDPEPYVEGRWVQPQDEGNLDADVVVEAG